MQVSIPYMDGVWVLNAKHPFLCWSEICTIPQLPWQILCIALGAMLSNQNRLEATKTTRRVGNRTRVHCDFSYERVVADMVKTRYFRGWVEGNDRNWLVICITTWFSWVKTHIRTSKSHGFFLTMFEDICVFLP